MALKGKLEEFPLTDIFQLIGQQQKSGSLFVSNNQMQARIVFDDGQIIMGSFQGSKKNLLFGTILLQSKVISQTMLDEALDLQKTTKRSVGDLLISKRYITPETFREISQIQLDEVLFELFSWEQGLYEFVQGKIKYNPSFVVPQRAEGVLMDCFRKKDEWPAIIKKLGSLNTIFEKSIAQDASLDKLEKNERLVLACMDGQTELEQVAFLSRVGTFEAANATVKLLEKKLIRLKANVEKTQNQKSKLVYLKTIMLVLALGVLMGFLFFSDNTHWKFKLRQKQSPQGLMTTNNIDLKDLLLQNQKDQIQLHIHIHKHNTGSNPKSLNEIGLDSSVLKKWNYTLTSEGYELSPNL